MANNNKDFNSVMLANMWDKWKTLKRAAKYTEKPSKNAARERTKFKIYYNNTKVYERKLTKH